jgi:hypothetical protein
LMVEVKSNTHDFCDMSLETRMFKSRLVDKFYPSAVGRRENPYFLLVINC